MVTTKKQETSNSSGRQLKMPGKSSLHGAVVAGCVAIVLSLVRLLPVAVDRVQLNTASLSPELQTWRARGQYYVHNR